MYGHSIESNKISMVYYGIYSNDKPVSIVMILLRKIALFGHVARINRGPLVLSDVNTLDHNRISIDTIKLIIQKCKQKRWWMLQIAPELPFEQGLIKELNKNGLKKLSVIPWASVLLRLDGSLEEVLMSFKSRWRRGLRKGMKQDISISLLKNTRKNINDFIEHYKEFKSEKNFDGLSLALIKKMCFQESNIHWAFNIFQAYNRNSDGTKNILGYLSSVRYGNTAIYLIGTRADLGKKLNTNYVLMWEAIIEAHKSGCKWFDVGGLNENTTKGIVQFKSGLNGQPYRLIGEWRAYIFPSLKFM